MFGFGLKDKTKKVLEKEFNHFNPTIRWLNHIIKQGNSQDFNEYDVAINYLMTDWEFKIQQCRDNPDVFGKEIKKSWLKTIKTEIKLLKLVEHKAHQDLDFRDRCKKIITEAEVVLK